MGAGGKCKNTLSESRPKKSNRRILFNVHTVECLHYGVQLVHSRKTLDGVVFWKIDSVVFLLLLSSLILEKSPPSICRTRLVHVELLV